MVRHHYDCCPHRHFLLLYDYFLTQLNVKHYIIFGVGNPIDPAVESISEAFEVNQNLWTWMMIIDENDNAYQCDILMDKYVLDEQRKSIDDYESDMRYFGMSDKTRKESFDIGVRLYAMSMDSNINNTGAKFPECKEDYK